MSGIVGAFGSASSALEAQTTRFGQIASDIANAATIGYKPNTINFQNTLDTTPAPLQLPGGVKPVVAKHVELQGELQQSTNPSDLGLLGKGFFVVANRTDKNGNVAANSDRALTRRGDFTVDANGNLVNGGGAALLGVAIPTLIPVSDNGKQTVKTVTINQANAAAATTGSLNGVNGPEQLVAVHIAANATIPAIQTSNVYVGVILPALAPLTGGEIYRTTATVTDANNVTHKVNFAFQRNGTAADPNLWTVTVTGDSGVAPTSFQLRFDNKGKVTGTESFAITVNGQTIHANFNGGNSTQVASASQQLSNNFTVLGTVQDGKPAGHATGWTISKTGIVSQSFSNGVTLPRYQIALAVVRNSGGLQPISGEAYLETPESGKIELALSSYGVSNAGPNSLDTGIVGGSLESSASDLATSFTDMITTQKNYSLNTRVLSVLDQMTQTVAQMAK